MSAPSSPKNQNPALPRFSCLHCKAKKLRCDRALPRCDRCFSLEQACVYPNSRITTTGRRVRVRELEVKLRQLEDRIGAGESGSDNSPQQASTVASTAVDVDDGTSSTSSRPIANNHRPNSPHNIGEHQLGEGFDDGVSLVLTPAESLGIRNQLVSSEIAKELTSLYFDRSYHGSPMIHRTRYESSLRRSPDLQPPQYLQHAIMATGASDDSKHHSLADPLYEHARMLAEADEMEGKSDHWLGMAQAQCWLLIANLEAQKGMFARAYISLGRSVRIAQMLNLHQLDQDGDRRTSLFTQYIPSRDWVEQEERRKTWWVIYTTDRLVFATSGLPAIIDDKTIGTRLPATEEAFINGVEEHTSTLAHAVRERAATHSCLATRVLASYHFRQAAEQESYGGPDGDDTEHTGNGEFWTNHERIDENLSYALLQLPSSLRLPQNSTSQDATFTNVILHTATMCLHKTAVCKAGAGDGSEVAFIRAQCQSRMLSAAVQIVAVFRLAQDLVEVFKNPIQNYAAYIAALAFLQDFIANRNTESQGYMVFLLSTLETAGENSSVARTLASQLKTELQRLDMRIPGSD